MRIFLELEYTVKTILEGQKPLHTLNTLLFTKLLHMSNEVGTFGELYLTIQMQL